jgi:hypothetical protein
VADYVIRIREVSPRAGAFVSAQAVIVADLEYAVPDSVWGVPSDELEFSIHVRFDSTEEGRTVAIGEESRVDLLDRSGRLTFIYPLGQIWNYRLLQHPVTVRFSLVAWSEFGEGIVVEDTGEIRYQELRL